MDLMDYRRKIIASSPHLSHAEGAVASFSDGTDLPLKSLLVNIEPVQSGTGDPSPSNIRPISGWSAVGLHDTGINVWDEQLNVGALNSRGNIDSNLTARITTSYIHIKPNTNYYISSPCVGGRYAYYDAGKNLIAYDGNGFLTNVITSPSDAHYMRITLKSSYGTSYNHDISINYPSTDHDYHAYTGTSVTIDLGRTVYGGTLNVLTGQLVVDRVGVKIADLAVSVAFKTGTATSFKRFVLSPTATSVVYTQKHGAISSFGKEGTAYYGSNRSNDNGSKSVNFAITTGGEALAIYDPDLTLTDETFMAKYGQQTVVYPLATSQTYTLDPQTVRSLVGQNNIFSDTGNIALDYWAHP